MNISIDKSRCQGIGLCEMHAPGVFEVGDDGYAELVDDNALLVSDADLHTAIESCPTQALRL